MSLGSIRERFFTRFPAAKLLDEALQTTSNPNPTFFLAPVSQDADLKSSGLVLLRLGDDLERRFGINGEVAVYFVPFRDFQRRSFNAITLRTADIVRSLQEETMRSERFTPSRRVALLLSADPQINSKVNEWQNDSYSELTVVPVNISENNPDVLLKTVITSLELRLGERDLYQTQNPVSGIDFFGRAGLLRRLTAAIEGDQNVAILGLRRSGKTSVLRELKQVLLPRRIIMPIADFQMLEAHSAEELASSIASSLNEELKVAKSKGIDVWIGNEADQAVEGLSPATLSDRIRRVASRNPNVRIVIAVDEVESAAAIAQTNPMSIKVLLGSLRSAAQARENVSLVFSGVANRMFRSSSLGPDGTTDNPMFNQVESVYLTSFRLEETAGLLRELGRPMLLDWQDDAVAELHRLTGGFPYFVRDFASTVRRALRDRDRDDSLAVIKIQASDVLAESQEWSARAAEAWAGIIAALGIHYPSAAALLDSTISQEELNEWADGDLDARDAADDLVLLNLLSRDGGGVRYSSTLSALQSLSRPLRGGMSPVFPSRSDESDDIVALVRKGESQVIEFKESSRINLLTKSKDSRIEDAVVKTVAAFLNSDGGSLLIGISDDGISKGIEPDLKLFKGSADRYQRWVQGDLLAKRIDRQLIADNVRLDFRDFRGKVILLVTVQKSGSPAWVDDRIIYRRLGNQTISLESGRDLQQFIAQRSSEMWG